MEGEHSYLRSYTFYRLTMPFPPSWQLYDLLLTIPAGRVSTYGQLATLLASSARAGELPASLSSTRCSLPATKEVLRAGGVDRGTYCSDPYLQSAPPSVRTPSRPTCPATASLPRRSTSADSAASGFPPHPLPSLLLQRKAPQVRRNPVSDRKTAVGRTRSSSC